MTNLLNLSPQSNHIIAKSKDKYLYTEKGNKVLDLQSGIWCTNIGHQNDIMLETIKCQVDKLIHLNGAFSASIGDELVNRLCKVLQIENGKGVFLSSGSEAVELGIKLSGIASGNKKKKLVFSNSYLSSYKSQRDDSWVTFDYGQCLDCTKQCDVRCEKIKDIHFDDIGVFILESINGRMSVKAPKKLVNYLLKNLNKDTIMMANEVTNGFGRTGKWFGFMHYEDFKPQIVSMGKALGNGYPISGVIVGKEVAKRIEKEGFIYVQSHLNDPLGCKIANNTIKFIEDNDLIEKGGKVSEQFVEKLSKSNISYIKEIRSHGLLISIDICESIVMKKLGEQLFDEGYFVGCIGQTIHLAPPLIIEIEELCALIDTLIKVDKEIERIK